MHTDVILAAIADVKADVAGVNNRLDTLNGRTRAIEVKVFAMWILWGLVGAVTAAILPPLIAHLLP